MRTFPTFTFGHAADAAFVCGCGGTLLATQRISPNQPFRLGITQQFQTDLSLRAGSTIWSRTFPTLTFGHAAGAAFVSSCGGTLLAAQRISPNQPFRASKLDNSKLPFRCTRVQQSGRGQTRLLQAQLSLTQKTLASAAPPS